MTDQQPETTQEPDVAAPTTGGQHQETPAPTDVPNDRQNGSSEPDEAGDIQQEGDREAAKNRRRYAAERDRADAAEAALHTARLALLRDTLSRMRTIRTQPKPNVTESITLAAAGPEAVDALFAEVDIDRLFDDDGQLDQAEVDRLLLEAAHARPYLLTRRRGYGVDHSKTRVPDNRRPAPSFLGALDPHRQA